MRLKLDENLSGPILKPALEALEHDVKTVQDENLSRRPDVDVLDAARKEARLLLTQDRHLIDLKRFPPGSHAGVVCFKPRKPRETDLFRFIMEFVKNAPLEDFVGEVVEVKPERYTILGKPAGS